MSLGVRLTSDRGIYYLAASCAFVCHATDAQRRGATACETSPCPPCRGDASAGGEKHSQFLNVVLASSGHRGRDDARGHRSGGATGLSRTSGRGAGVPSRDRRARRLRRCVLGVALREYAKVGRHRTTGSGQLNRQITTRSELRQRASSRPKAVARLPVEPRSPLRRSYPWRHARQGRRGVPEPPLSMPRTRLNSARRPVDTP